MNIVNQQPLTLLASLLQPLEDGYMSVSYGNVVGVLIEAIKELKAEIEVLKGQIK